MYDQRLPTLIRQVKIVTIQNDVLVCKTWDGSTLGTAEFLVARPPLLRVSDLVANGWNGYTFTEILPQAVDADGGGGTVERWRITPEYVAEDVIIALGPLANGGHIVDPDGPNRERVALVDLNVDGRCWAHDTEITP